MFDLMFDISKDDVQSKLVEEEEIDFYLPSTVLLTIIEGEPNPENITTIGSNTTTCTNDSQAAVDKIPVDTTIHTYIPNNTIKEVEDLEQTKAVDRAQRREEQAQELEEFRTQSIAWRAANNEA